MSQKCVLICIPVLLKGGGTEIQVLRLIEVLITGGYRVTVCCYYEFDQSIVEVFKKAGAEVVLLGLNRSDGRFGPFKIVELIRKLSQTFQKYHPDIVHVQYLAPGLIPIIAARLARVPTVFSTVHIAGSIVYGKKAKILLRIAASLCTAFFCVSKGVEEFWFSNSEVFDPGNPKRNRKHFTIYNAIDVGRINEIVREGDRQGIKQQFGISGRPVIGIVGRLAPQKGHTFLLDAMVEVVKKIPDIVLLVIGDGPDKNSLEQRAESLELQKNVKWLGVKEQKEVFKLYGTMDIFVMPSLYEGFGLTAAEAMAAGRPVLASNVEGLNEVVVNTETGYLFPPGDSKALVEGLIKFLENPGLREKMGRKGHEVVEKEFSLPRFQKAILAAYAHFTEIHRSARDSFKNNIKRSS